MKKLAGATAILLSAGLVLTACSSNPSKPEAEEPKGDAPATVTITDNHGEVEVPVNPETVVALDNTTFDTLSDWGIELAAAPKGVMGSAWPGYTDNDKVADVGNHREPNLETIIAAQPDVIIGGYRFGDYYEDLKSQNPNAVVIEINARDGEDQFSELKRQTEILGQIFDKEAEATALNDELDKAISGAKEAYNGSDTVMAVNTSGGKIGYLAPVVGRALGPVFPALDLVAALEAEGDGDHKGNDIGVEAIAQSNPDWIFALDRDASFAKEDREEGSAPAEELIMNSEALANVTAVQKNQVVILDPNFYLTEGIQAYISLFNAIEDALANA